MSTQEVLPDSFQEISIFFESQEESAKRLAAKRLGGIGKKYHSSSVRINA